MSINNPTYEGLKIESVKQGLDGAIYISWSCPLIGFGEVCIWWQDGKLHLDNEYMSDAFSEEIMKLLVEEMVKEN